LLSLMPDRLTPEQRSHQMALVKSKDTGPEMIVRRLVYSLGYRYRLHSTKLVGKPDLVFASRKKVIFVHGCFWHRHSGCKHATTPATRQDYWLTKFSRTVERDKRTIDELKNIGWDVFIIWECEVKNTNQIISAIINFLE
jgi:DNA mismatch endonuclease (patch repair protein)